ncbi:hypothetical protein HDU97_002521, partial [Phlyctochytrium planicorne]
MQQPPPPYSNSDESIPPITLSWSDTPPGSPLATSSSTTSTLEGRTLILFVHGFFGSEASFATFPADLVHSLRRSPHGLRGLECRNLPAYDCKGDITKAVNHLCNWLTMNAAAPEFDSVVILAHSMGGLLAVDAFRKLYDADRQWIPPAPKPLKKEKSTTGSSSSLSSSSSSWFGGFWEKKADPGKAKDDAKRIEEVTDATKTDEKTGDLAKDSVTIEDSKPTTDDKKEEISKTADSLPSTSTPSKSNSPKIPTRPNKNDVFLPEVNIIAIIAFDSPFFGLHPSVYTSAAPTRAASIVSPYIPTVSIPESLKSAPSAAYKTVAALPAKAGSAAWGAAGAAASTATAAASAAASTASAAASAAASSATAAASAAASTASAAASNLPSVAWGAATSARDAVGSLPGVAVSAAEGTKNAVGYAVTRLPAAAAEGAMVAASRAGAAVSYLPVGVGQAMGGALRAVNEVSAYTASKVVDVVGHSPTVPGQTKEEKEQLLASRMTQVALNALPGVAIAGAAAAVSALPAAVGLAAAIVPRITWGRMVVAGASAVVAATVVGETARKEREKELNYLVEEVKDKGKEKEKKDGVDGETAEKGEVDGSRDADAGGDDVDEEDDQIRDQLAGLSIQEPSSAKKPAATLPGDDGDVTVLFEGVPQDEEGESDPTITFDAADGTKADAIAETAGLETVTLIAAAALAHARGVGPNPASPAGAEGKDEEAEVKPGASPEENEETVKKDPLEQAETLDSRAGSILRKASMSVLKASGVAASGAAANGSGVGHGDVKEVLKVMEEEEEAGEGKVGETKTDDGQVATDGKDGEGKELTVAVASDIGSGEKPAAEEEAETTPIQPPSSSWMPWLTVGLAGAAIAAGTYYTGGLLLAAPLVQSVAVTWAATHVNEASKHLQFLYPLWGETQEHWNRRVEVLQGEVGVGKLVFRCFYIE